MKTKIADQFTDAQFMRIKNPDTFEAPNYEELNALKKGDFVKVCRSPERFWCEVLKIEGETIEGRVDNELIHGEELGFNYNDIINFEHRHIYAIDQAKD